MTVARYTVFCVLCVVIVSAIAVQEDTQFVKVNLPPALDVTESNYTLSLTYDLTESNITVKGNVEIKFKSESFTELTLMVGDLDVKKVTCNEQSIPSAGDLLPITSCGAPDAAETNTLTVEYEAIAKSDENCNFCLLTETNELTGVQKPIMIVNKYSTGIQNRLFPNLYTKTTLRSKFTTTITVNTVKDVVVLSNVEAVNPKRDTKYKPTTIDSIIAEEISVALLLSPTSQNNSFYSQYMGDDMLVKSYKTWSNSNKGTELSLSAGKQLIEYISKLLNMGYRFTKLDVVSLPQSGFDNTNTWGILTYSENLIRETEMSSGVTQHNILLALANGIAKQWFGSFIGADSLTNVWLTEGLANYLSYIAADSVTEAEDWDLLNLYVVEEMYGQAFKNDIYSSIKNLGFEPITEDDVTDKYSRTLIAKSGSIMRMLSDAIGDEIFFNGIREFLQNMMEQNPTVQDFMETLQSAYEQYPINKPVLDDTIANLTELWLVNQHYPIITTLKNNGNIEIKQASVTGSPARWNVPVSYVFNNGTVERTWLFANGPSIVSIPIPKGAEWYRVNIGQKGYYRVSYEEDNLKALTSVIDDFDPLTRTQIITDALISAKLNLLTNYSRALDLTKSLAVNSEYVVLKGVLDEMEFFYPFLSTDENFQTYIQNLLSGVNMSAAWDPNAKQQQQDRMKTNLVTNWMCKVELESCTTQAATLLTTAIANRSWEMNNDARPAIYCTGLRKRGRSTFLSMWDRLNSTTDLEERRIIIDSLGCISSPDVTPQYMKNLTDPDLVELTQGERLQGLMAVYRKNPANMNLVLDAILKQLGVTSQAFEPSLQRNIGTLLLDVVNHVSTSVQYTMMNRIIKALDTLPPGPAYYKTIKEDVTAVLTARETWYTAHYATIRTWFRVNKDSVKPAGGSAVMITSSFLCSALFLLLVTIR